MPDRRSAPLLVAGAALVLAGLGCWAAGLDLPLHRALRLGWSDAGVRRVAWFTALGGLAVQGPLALAAVLWLAARRRAADAAWLFATVLTGRLLVDGAKLVVHRPRPPVGDRLELVTSWSFPSSHAAGTTLTCLALAALSGAGRPAWIAAVALAAAIGWSRVALAVHWPGDVLAGWGAGAALIGLALAIRPNHPRRPALGHGNAGETR